MAPFISEVLISHKAVGWEYVEPYAGGAGVAMELLLDNKVSRVHLNDSSPHIYSFWKVILEDPDSFCRRIHTAALNVVHWRKHREVVREPLQHSLADLAFSTFYLNRCNRSGILTAGVIGGAAQEGRWRIDARFPRNELVKRIEIIAARGKDITLTNLDAEAFMIDRVNHMPPETLVYCDPPYYERAERLYLNIYAKADHSHLARVIQRKLQRPWIVSYDGHADIIGMYSGRRRFIYDLQYSAIKPYKGREVFVFADELTLPRSSVIESVSCGLNTITRFGGRARRLGRQTRIRSQPTGRRRKSSY